MFSISSVVLLAVCGHVAFSSPVSSQPAVDKCARGPEYWCQNIQIAKSCGATKHCIQEVWKRLSLPTENNDVCTTCKDMVKQARDQLESNETQEEIKQVFEGTCRIYFPIRALSDECIKFVDEYIPDLIEMLAERMDPQLVCSTAGLCNVEKVLKMLGSVKVTSKYATATDCQDCKNFVNDINEKVHKMTKDEIEKKVLNVCKSLGYVYSSMCDDLVRANIDKIYQYLENDLNPNESCQLVGMCDETTNIPTMPSVIELFIHSRESDPECDFCEQLIQHLKDMISANSTEEEVKQTLLALCKNLGSYEKQCEGFVNDFFQEIYEFITNELDPHNVCSALGLCTNSTLNLKVAMAELFPATKFNAVKPNPNILIQLESNSIDEIVPKSNQVSGDKVKTKVPFSRHEVVPTVPESLQLPETRLIPQALIMSQSKPGCALCEYALHELQNMLMENKTEEAIKQALDKLCSVLPQTIADQCTAFVNEYGDAILALLAQELDPSQVCVTLKLCPGQETVNVRTRFPFHKSAEVIKSSATNVDKSIVQLPASRLMPQAIVNSKIRNSCETCQFVMGVIHVMLGDNKTKEAIEYVLQEACNVLPSSIRSDCVAFVDQFGDELLTLLQNTDPNMICSLIGLCSSQEKPSITVPVKTLRLGKCDTCQLVVDYVDKLLEDQTVETEITQVLEKVCGVVPAGLREECNTIIETYGPYLLQLLGELADSQKVCQALDLCQRPNGQVHLLGGNRCLYGPAYWCQSKIHAKACKAEKHCADHVWSN